MSESTPHHLLPEVPEPVLFNSWKHHAGALRDLIARAATTGDAGLSQLRSRLIIIGHELMDLYLGAMAPYQIGEEVVRRLRDTGRLELDAYRRWLEPQDGFGVLTLDDGSRWVLRLGDETGRYVHLHPARWAPETRRVRANVLKTAILANTAALVRDQDPLDVGLINQVRQQYLDLSPVPAVHGNQGLAPVIELLRVRPDPAVNRDEAAPPLDF